MSNNNDIIVVCGGSFNPIHELHLLIFELVKNYFQERGRKVVHGIISPVNDQYWKSGLLESTHRLAMCRLAVKSSDWIVVDDWESQQTDYVRTYNYLSHVKSVYGDKFDIFFICADDLLENMINPGQWDQVLLDKLLGEFGMVVMKRVLDDAAKVINDNDILFKHKDHIFLCDSFQSQHNSYQIRELVSKGLSVKYMVPDSVLDYIKTHKLYLQESNK
ncbi:nicotinamide-nucleotide adenylyltransferase [Entamoeba marina]